MIRWFIVANEPLHHAPARVVRVRVVARRVAAERVVLDEVVREINSERTDVGVLKIATFAIEHLHRQTARRLRSSRCFQTETIAGQDIGVYFECAVGGAEGILVA